MHRRGVLESYLYSLHVWLYKSETDACTIIVYLHPSYIYTQDATKDLVIMVDSSTQLNM